MCAGVEAERETARTVGGQHLGHGPEQLAPRHAGAHFEPGHGAQRQKAGLSQTVVAARMGTSASVVSKLEDGADVKISTLIRYCEAIGQPWSYNPRRR